MVILFAIGLLAYGVRMAEVALHPETLHYLHHDTFYYLENAESILTTGLPTLNSAPIGLSYILCIFFKLGLSFRDIAWIVQPLVGTADCLLVCVLCAQFGHRRAGLVAAAVCAIHPSLVNSSSQILTEDWAMLFVLLALIASGSRKKWMMLSAGFLMGFACAIRAPCLGSLAGLVVWWLWRDRFKALPRVALFTAGAALPIAVVSIHLSAANHGPVFLTLQTYEASVFKPTLGSPEMTSEAERQQRGSYLQFALRDPAAFLKERWESFVTFASPWPFGGDRSLLRKCVVTLSDGAVISTALAAGFILWRRQRRSEWFVMVWLPCCLCLFYTLFYSYPRYRVPTLPLLIGFSALVLVPPARRNAEAMPDREAQA
jgi:4-amino-4-deoxy-L-arabinose transferase-like glycosyltransferase